MGATVVAVHLHQERMCVVNVGDSRAYRVEDKGLVQLSVDDSLGGTWRYGSGAARTGMLLQCFGGRPTFTDIEPHLHVEPCVPGNTYLLCCDGLYETLPEEQIKSLIGADLKASAEELLRAALDMKARDNVTIALVRVLG